MLNIFTYTNWRSGASIRTCLLVVVLAAGCGDSSEVGLTYPVSGTVIIDDDPLDAASAQVWLYPDASKDNDSPFEPAGKIDADGNYSVQTLGKAGAPPGWYKVVVTALAAAPQHPRDAKQKRPVGKSLVPAKYGSIETTDLAIEVVEQPEPGAYDLELTTK